MDIGIADSSCIIGFSRIGRLDILRSQFSVIISPEVVKLEVGEMPAWIDVASLADVPLLSGKLHLIHPGEEAVIRLGLQRAQSVVILDDYHARKLASGLGLRVIGTLGLILRAKQTGILPECKPLLDSLILNEFRMSQTLYNQVLALAREH